MKYYVTVNLTISDDSWVADYLPAVTALVNKHGGQYLARTPTVDKIEGAGDPPNISVIIEWPSKEAAEAFYGDPDYQPFLQRRNAGSSGDLLLIAGEDIAAA